MKTRKQALCLKSHFEIVSRAFRLNIHVMISNGSAPIGNGIGPALEAADVLQVLRNDPLAAPQIERKSMPHG